MKSILADFSPSPEVSLKSTDFWNNFNQTSIVERDAKELPPIKAKSKTQSTPSKDTPADSTDKDGYEWLKTEDGIDWYRAAESGDEWAKFES